MVEAATPGSFILVVRGVAGQLVKVQWQAWRATCYVNRPGDEFKLNLRFAFVVFAQRRTDQAKGFSVGPAILLMRRKWDGYRNCVAAFLRPAYALASGGGSFMCV